MLLLVASAVPLNLGSQWQLKVHTLATTECCYWGGGCGGHISKRCVLLSQCKAPVVGVVQKLC